MYLMENTHTWTCQNDLGMTVQEYASTYKLSYETVRAKIIRYKEELEGEDIVISPEVDPRVDFKV